MSQLYDQKAFQSDLDDAISSFKAYLKTVSVGKANAEAINSVPVEAYGSEVQLQTIGQVIVEDAVNVKITIWDKGVLPNAEKALRESNLGASVAVDGSSIRLKYNPITEEDRSQRVKDVKDALENSRIRVRGERQNVMKKLEGLEGVSEDDVERSKEEVQEMIDTSIEKLEKVASEKEQDLMSF